MAINATSQTTEFTYQGSLKDNGFSANGNYDFEFRVFDALTGGNQIGSVVTRTGVAVSNGIFSVVLDFGNGFPGADRFLEIRVRNTGSGGYTNLDPRQKISSAPYALKSLAAESATSANTAISATSATFATTAGSATNASQLGGVAANQFVQTADPRLTDARTPTAGSGNYVQNTTSQQSASNFNISGTGTVAGTLSGGIVNANTQFNIGGNRILSNSGIGNLFIGTGTGTVNTGTSNSFIGNLAGQANTTGIDNSFFGRSVGLSNTSGSGNSFFGRNAGSSNLLGNGNSFFGMNAGTSNSNADDNSFFGSHAGEATTGGSNSFFGTNAGKNNTGCQNSFFGKDAGQSSSSLCANSFFGASAGKNNTGVNNSFFGNNAGAFSSGGANAFVGVGAGSSNTSGSYNSFFGGNAGNGNSSGSNNTALGENADFGSSALIYATAIGSDAIVSASNTIALGRTDGSDRVRIYGRLAINTLAAATSTNLCVNTLTDEVASCSSSIRYKTNVAAFNTGLSFVNRLRPVTFDWKESNENDLGLIAEEVEAINPLLVTYNKSGEVQGVKYDRLSVVFVNALKEQQAQIETQAAEIVKLKKDLESLKALLCSKKIDIKVCRQNR